MLLLVACSDQELVDHKEDPAEILDTGAAPDVTVTPESIDFGELVPGTETTAVVTIGNVGEGPLHIDGVRFADDEAELTVTSVTSPVVDPGATVETVVTWIAGTAPMDATLLVDSDDPDEPEVAVPIQGSVPPGDIVVDPAFHDFGTLEVGASTRMAVAVSNVGLGQLTVTEVDYTATDADLRVVDAGVFATLPRVLAPGETAWVTVEYAPSAAGGDEGSLAIVSDDPDTPSIGAQQAGNAEDDPCAGFTQTVTLVLTADDAWRGWLDGTEFNAPGQNAWSSIDTLEWELECGDHTLALYATDTANVISGVLAAVLVEGTVRFVSGPANWTMIDSAPAGDWTTVGYDDSAWNIPQLCADTSPWGSTPDPLYVLGAQWIWWTTQCRNLGEGWLRLNFTVP